MYNHHRSHPVFCGGSHPWSWPGCRCLLFLFLFLLPLEGLEGRENRVVRVAFSASIISEANLNDTRLAMEIWTRKLTNKMGFDYRIEVRFFKDFPSLVRAAEKKEVDFVQLTSLDYLGLKDRNVVEPVLSSMKNKNLREPLFLLVHRESSIRSSWRGGQKRETCPASGLKRSCCGRSSLSRISSSRALRWKTIHRERRLKSISARPMPAWSAREPSKH